MLLSTISPKVFHPISIVLETVEEANVLLRAIARGRISGDATLPLYEYLVDCGAEL